MPRVVFAACKGPWLPPRLHLFPRTGKIGGWMLRRCNTVRAWDTGDLLPFPLAMEGRILTGSRVDVRGTPFAYWYLRLCWLTARPLGQVRLNEVILLCLSSVWDG